MPSPAVHVPVRPSDDWAPYPAVHAVLPAPSLPVKLPMPSWPLRSAHVPSGASCIVLRVSELTLPVALNAQ